MTQLNPDLLHVKFVDGADDTGPLSPRVYTLTNSDMTGYIDRLGALLFPRWERHNQLPEWHWQIS